MSNRVIRPTGAASGASDAPISPEPGEDGLPSSELPVSGRARAVSDRAVFTALATLLSRGANIFLLILLTPFLFAGLGEKLFGIYQLTQRVSQFGGMASLGASNYLKIRLAEMYADEDAQERRKAIGDCIMQWAILSPALALWIFLTYQLISGRTGVSGSQAVAVMVLITLMPLGQLLSVGNIALFTHHRGYMGVPLWTGIAICASALAAAAAYLGYGIEGVAAALAAGTLLNGLSSLVLARKLLPWFGVEWPSLREFLGNFGKSFGAAVASMVYLGLQLFEALIVGLGAGPVVLARLVLTVVGVQCLDTVVRSFIGTAAYAVAPLVRERQAERIASIRVEAHGNIVSLFAVAGPAVIAFTPVIIPIWIRDAVLLSPAIAVAILLTSMFRLLATFDAALLDQARDFHWKNVAAAIAVFSPGAALGLLLFWRAAPDGWYWLLPASMGLYWVLVALRCRRLLSVGTAWTTLAIPIFGALAASVVTSALLDMKAHELTLIGVGTFGSVLSGVACLLHPKLAGPVRKLIARLFRAARRIG